MATLKVKFGYVRTPIPKPLIRRGHASASTFFDQFKKAKAIRRSNALIAPPLGVSRSVARQTVANAIRKELNLRSEKLVRHIPVVDPSRLNPVKSRVQLSPTFERGDSPFRRKILRHLRKAGVI